MIDYLKKQKSPEGQPHLTIYCKLVNSLRFALMITVWHNPGMIQEHHTREELIIELRNGKVKWQHDPVEKTIASGAITGIKGGRLYIVDTEGAASSDDLTDITFDATVNASEKIGSTIWLKTKADARDVVLKKTGTINFGAGLSITLPNTGTIAELTWDGTDWLVVSHTGDEADA